MHRVIALYKFREGVDREKFRAWSKSVDQPAVRAQPSVVGFQVFEIKKSSKGKPEYDVCEVIDVKSFEEWEKDFTGDALKPIGDAWRQFGDADTLVSLSMETV